MEEDPAKRISLGIILEYAQYLVPIGRAHPDGRLAGHAAGPAALLGPEPLHQAA